MRGVIVEPPTGAAARARLLDQMLDNGEPHDLVILKNGDLLIGEFSGLDEKNLLLETPLGKSAIERKGILAMIFNPSLSSNEPLAGEGALVSLVDGSRFRVKDAKTRSARPTLAQKPAVGQLPFRVAAGGGRIAAISRGLRDLSF